MPPGHVAAKRNSSLATDRLARVISKLQKIKYLAVNPLREAHVHGIQSCVVGEVGLSSEAAASPKWPLPV